MINISVSKKHFTLLSKGWFRKVAEMFSQEESIGEQKNASVILVGDPKIKSLNRDYRQVDQVTDVLSFNGNTSDDFDVDEDKNYLGEIFICVPQAKRQAKINNNTFKNEMAWLLIHGLAHLTGYDHENVSKDDSQKMYDLENRVLDRLGFSKNEFYKE
jgi:probable rRNA maturation factor